MEGGLEQHLTTLVSGLGAEGDEQCSATVVVSPRHRDWVRPCLKDSDRLVWKPERPRRFDERLRQTLGPLRAPAGRVWRRALRTCGFEATEQTQPVMVRSDGFYERLGVDVIHFPYIAHYEQTELPSVVTIHDLQHLHFPQFFTPASLEWRHQAYRLAAAHATMVATCSHAARRDIIEHVGVADDKVAFVPHASFLWAMASPTASECSSVRQRFKLPESFALYPALTYEHKNHLRLLDAVARIRDEGKVVNLVCVGKQKLFWTAIAKRLDELELHDRVRFTGFVTTRELLAIYRLAEFLVYPTLFEGAGLPVLEAMQIGLPMACAEIPPVQEYAGDAALYFEPTSVDAMAGALVRMKSDAELRRTLRQRGLDRSAQFAPHVMASQYRALYREAIQRWTPAHRGSHAMPAPSPAVASIANADGLRLS
jgi:glycosyltransferase involved in cell wall biosynthesis